jgi:EAL domain-containing protein (putative c-di-GMP-specific phosphodiesterase class I)
MIDEQGDEVSASEFMEVARRNKMMRPLDRWVIGASLDFAASQHFDLVFIKLSGETVGDASSIDWIKSQTESKKVPPSRLCFQISESDATQHLKQTLKIVGELRSAGFKFAIEHFGIGRDPIRLLNQMPMDYVKIDGSLMEGIGGDNFRQEKIRGFVNTALKRKVATIAERVEDANTMAVLFQLGIGYMQGHYLHEPDVVLEELI